MQRVIVVAALTTLAAAQTGPIDPSACTGTNKVYAHGRCYELFTSATAYPTAESNCETHTTYQGAHLAVANDAAVFATLKNLVSAASGISEAYFGLMTPDSESVIYTAFGNAEFVDGTALDVTFLTSKAFGTFGRGRCWSVDQSDVMNADASSTQSQCATKPYICEYGITDAPTPAPTLAPTTCPGQCETCILTGPGPDDFECTSCDTSVRFLEQGRCLTSLFCKDDTVLWGPLAGNSCTCEDPNCFYCVEYPVTGEFCKRCENYKYLTPDGVPDWCVDECPAPLTEQGTGEQGRKCV